MNKFKKTFLISFLLSIVLVPYAQNLVPNPGFENYTSCPTTHGEVNLASPWISPTTGSSDYFNTCVGSSCSNISPWVCVPNNWLGTQMPHNGNAYAGFFIKWSSSTNYREYIQTPLLSPMVAEQYYEVSFYVSLADKAKFASNNLHVYFSNTPISRNDNSVFTCCTPQLSPGVNYIKEKLNWVRVSMCYQATGDEEYMTIGNFSLNNSTSLYYVGSDSYNTKNSYYYIDDVAIIPFDGDCDTIVSFDMPNVFSPNGDGINEMFLPKSTINIEEGSFSIYNRWGMKMFESKSLIDGWDGTYDGELCTAGTYYWMASYQDFRIGTKTLKGFLTLFR